VPPLLIVTWVRRRLPETHRFRHAQEENTLAARWHAIFRRPHRRRLLLVCTTSLLLALTTQAGAFVIDFMQTNRGLSSEASNLVLVAAGVPAIPILIWSGALSDRYGRRLVGCAFLGLMTLGTLG